MKLPLGIDPCFFSAVHHEAAQPLVVSGGSRDQRHAVAMFSSTAVIFAAAEPPLRFQWCGPVSAASAARLQAASVDHGDDPAALLPALQAAWVYLACEPDVGVPVQLVQAMACGLPCVAAHLPAHRALIDDGVNGLLFRRPEEAHQLLGLLVDDAGLRRRLGRAARAAALQRFGTQAREAATPVLVAAALPLLPQRAADG